MPVWDEVHSFSNKSHDVLKNNLLLFFKAELNMPCPYPCKEACQYQAICSNRDVTMSDTVIQLLFVLVQAYAATQLQ